MPNHTFARRTLAALAIVFTCSFAAAEDREASYKTPYSVEFSYPLRELIGDLESTPRGNPAFESTVPANEWYSGQVRERYGAWGPPAVHYPAPVGLAGKSNEWLRERVIAVAMRFQGYTYQHHHCPDWSPPAGWPWKTVRSGKNGKGVDCSNFTAFVYNQGLGIKLTGEVHDQGKNLEVSGPGPGHTTKAHHIDLPKEYEKFESTFRTGDLLFVRSDKGQVSHVVIWVGPIGRSPDDVPLIIDSTGDGHRDSNGVDIPEGVHLRPFVEKSWYFRNADHVVRIIPDGAKK